MIEAGTILANPVTKEQLTFLKTSAETNGGLAADGKMNAKGMPNPFRLAVIANHHFGDVQLPVVPRWIQRAALALGAPVGKALGFQPVYVSEGEAAPATA